MTPADLFTTLDLDSDGLLTRAELQRAARDLGWHWHEAPVYAVLDLLTVPGPLSRSTLLRVMDQMLEDPLGPYGKVLRHTPVHGPSFLSRERPTPRPTFDPDHRPADAARFLQDLRQLRGRLRI